MFRAGSKPIDTRQIIGLAILAFLGLAFVAAAWFIATSRRRQRRRENRNFDRATAARTEGGRDGGAA